MDEAGNRSGIAAATLQRDHGDKTRAGFEVGIVEFSVALVVLEVGGVGGREKCALMMVEPPGDLGRRRVLEIDDGVFVAIEMGFIKQRSGAVQKAGKDEVGVFANALAIKTGEERGGGS